MKWKCISFNYVISFKFSFFVKFHSLKLSIFLFIIILCNIAACSWQKHLSYKFYTLNRSLSIPSHCIIFIGSQLDVKSRKIITSWNEFWRSCVHLTVNRLTFCHFKHYFTLLPLNRYQIDKTIFYFNLTSILKLFLTYYYLL